MSISSPSFARVSPLLPGWAGLLGVGVWRGARCDSVTADSGSGTAANMDGVGLPQRVYSEIHVWRIRNNHISLSSSIQIKEEFGYNLYDILISIS